MHPGTPNRNRQEHEQMQNEFQIRMVAQNSMVNNGRCGTMFTRGGRMQVEQTPDPVEQIPGVDQRMQVVVNAGSGMV
jgi:hypothetical protein